MWILGLKGLTWRDHLCLCFYYYFISLNDIRSDMVSVCEKIFNQLYILISFGSEFQMMMTPQLSERLNKERTAWIPLVIQWVGLLVCMNAMVLEETRYDDSYSDCCTFVQFSAMMAILEAFSLLKVMVCLLLNMAATYCNKHTFFVIIMNSVYGPLNVCLIHMVWI